MSVELKDYAYVIKKLRKSLDEHNAMVNKYEEVATQRKKELAAAESIVNTAKDERDQIVNAINMLQALDRGSVNDE